MLLLIRFMRGVTIELLGVVAFLFALSAARPDTFRDISAAIESVAARPAAGATMSSAEQNAPLLSLDDWRWTDDTAQRSDYVSSQLATASDCLSTVVAEHLSETWRDVVADRR